MPEDKLEKMRLKSEERRHAAELRSKEREARRDRRLDWWRSGDMPKVLAFSALLLFGGTVCALVLMFANAKWFGADAACSDTAEVLTANDRMRHCPGGGQGTTETMGEGRVLFRCSCSARNR